MMDKLRSFSHWLGDFCLRLILLVGMSIVFSAGVYMSWEHTTAMAIRLGNPPSHANAYTWFVETLLVVSEIVVLFQASRRRRPHKSVFVGVAFGATINLASNVSSFLPSLIPVKIGGIIMGATIPAGTAIAIWIFAEALISATTTTRQTNDKTATDNAAEDLDRQDSDMSDRRLSDKITDKLKTMGIVGQTLVKTVAGDKTTDRQGIDNGQTTTTRQTTSDRQTNDTTIDDQTQTQTADSDKAATAKLIDTTTRQLDRQTIDTITQTGNMGKTTDRQQDNTSTNSKVDKTKRHAKLSLIKGKNDKDQIIKQKAIDYYNRTGKFPSYRQLGEMAGVSKDKAGRIIKALKQKIS